MFSENCKCIPFFHQRLNLHSRVVFQCPPQIGYLHIQSKRIGIRNITPHSIQQCIATDNLIHIQHKQAKYIGPGGK